MRVFFYPSLSFSFVSGAQVLKQWMVEGGQYARAKLAAMKKAASAKTFKGVSVQHHFSAPQHSSLLRTMIYKTLSSSI